MKSTYFYIFILFMNCNKKPDNYIFNSNFGYSILLPENWSEYEDEENTNAFFDSKEWTGNLRITPIKIDANKNAELLKSEMESFNGKAEPFKTKTGFEGLKYSEKSNKDFIYYWYIIAQNKMFICSFTIDLDKKETPENQKELIKVTEIINSIELKAPAHNSSL
ncbi:DUF3805 domain-containing protein [Flavobacterium sp. J49]|uniref:DUF3805 domain-containing protein n=1 Tax=Flavobacterium sp. J49 TaxID=2718534 RepID=UPI0015937558|nr:DUF3805 domain-containing protein [Flavobacterium sp. J49]MBF6640221.1 DUF3805 domain-containing protein [Flavobacterium sp. J49]NIC01466.1 DUF3805 domain-containing protein [Flavobacterium sp. J49]